VNIETFQDGRLIRRADDTARTVTTWDAQGAATARPYTSEENAAADAAAAAAQAAADDAVRVAVDRAILDAIRHTSETGHVDGETWAQPSGAHDAYPLDAVVTHNGSTWTSLIPANVWAPGVSGWRQEVPEGPAPWAPPTGAHDAYALGAQVTHAGQTWTSTVGSNVWAPGVYGWTPA